MPTCGFINATGSRQRSRPAQALAPRVCVATRAGTLALYALTPSTASGDAGAAQGESAPGVAEAASGADSGEWQAELLKELPVCRPLQHFRERQLSPRSMAASARPRVMASPRLGPAASPRAGYALASPRASVGSFDASALSPRVSSEEAAAAEAAKWLSQVETATHAPMEVPIWHCPQLSFHTYPDSMRGQDINDALRAGATIAGCKTISVSRPERASDQVHYDGAESLSGALGTAVDEDRCERPARPAARPGPTGTRAPPSLIVAPAWGNIGDQPTVEHISAVGTGLEHVDEDWVKA